MCGIAGILLRPGADLPDLQERLQRMATLMHHRGPDDEGIYVSPDGRVGFANRRLAIRDLSPAGHMPMANPAQNVWITYNGEVYNADKLRPELEALGYSFRSTSDTEVILHGYEAWGCEIVPRLRGMFAFAIHDFRSPSAPQFLLARDHMGIKPVYYAQTPSAFVFASELKSLLASGLISKEISASGLVGYLLMGSVPNPLTIYADAQALEPSSYLHTSLPLHSTLNPVQYWSLPTGVSNVRTLDEAVEQTRALLEEAVRIRLVSDVPLGAFLSGGLDSSAVVALMRRATQGTIRTCSMVFEEAEYSEAPYARAVAEHLGTEHFERVITADDLLKEFENILYSLDQPSVDGVNTYFVSQTARQAGLTVALSGLGGDELFGGYPNTFSDVPRVHRALSLAQSVPMGATMGKTAIRFFPNAPKWSRISDALDRPASLASAYLTRRGLFSPAEVKQLVHPDVWAAAQFDPVAHVAGRTNGNGGGDTFAWVSRAELRTYTHHQLLRDTDVMSMAHSLEVRVPLLDRQLVALLLKYPATVKVIGNERPKPLLGAAVQDLLPRIVLDRRDKQGFTFPFAKWLRAAMQTKVTFVSQQIESSVPIRKESFKQMFDQFQSGQLHWSRVWALTALGCLR
ncbi:MAG: asparagine synthase (glutamine-hydrolyzing) [Anaerolinea sp.]|nr:asparagine synthase (glutamine-hydrolyzing) [Anaerolinea sp.]